MRKLFILCTLIILGGWAVFGQDDSAAPVRWEQYKNGEIGLSVMLPKMPVMSRWEDVCSQTGTVSYAVYAEDVVYRLNVTYRSNIAVPEWCTTPGTFDRSRLDNKIAEIRQKADPLVEEKSVVDRKEILKISDPFRTYWVVDDVLNGRWYELIIFHREGRKVDPKSFVDSVRFSSDPTGIEIGAGAQQALGDASKAVAPLVPIEEMEDLRKQPEFSNVLVEFRPKASYTDLARKKGIKGSVRLRLALRSNGSIGDITVLKGLPHGLTEEAIKAVRKIVFIPAQRGDKNISIPVQFEYGFSIY